MHSHSFDYAAQQERVTNIKHKLDWFWPRQWSRCEIITLLNQLERKSANLIISVRKCKRWALNAPAPTVTSAV